MRVLPLPRRPRAGAPRAASACRRAASLAALACFALAGCGTSHPRPIGGGELAEAQTFPYYRVYWVGPSFDDSRLAGADGLKSYDAAIGDGLYYGDCVQNKGLFGGGSSCPLPLQVTTVVYAKHNNESFGHQQRNLLLRGVPATVYNEGHAIELYSGRVSIDIFADSYAHALQAAARLRPVNAPGSASANLPPPVYCPELSGYVSPSLARVMNGLPRHVCQYTEDEETYIKRVNGEPLEG
ncbi:MAG TPA: hypothetical protein VGY13_14950 [Solirubrobacteraceae bacterium]|jgi:hypothetical protein|nr:hypothetical protein [Solirubrobacteraceae bacterium]